MSRRISIVLAMAASGKLGTGLNIHVRKKISVIFMSLLGMVLLVLFVANTGITSLLFLVLPLSILVGAIFIDLDKQIAEILHFILFIAALTFQFVV